MVSIRTTLWARPEHTISSRLSKFGRTSLLILACVCPTQNFRGTQQVILQSVHLHLSLQLKCSPIFRPALLREQKTISSSVDLLFLENSQRELSSVPLALRSVR